MTFSTFYSKNAQNAIFTRKARFQPKSALLVPNIPPGPEGGGEEGGGGGTDLGGGQASAGRLEGGGPRGMAGRTPRRGPRGRQEVAWEARELVWKARHGAQIAPR